jgi:hypothetical protein
MAAMVRADQPTRALASDWITCDISFRFRGGDEDEPEQGDGENGKQQGHGCLFNASIRATACLTDISATHLSLYSFGEICRIK